MRPADPSGSLGSPFHGVVPGGFGADGQTRAKAAGAGDRAWIRSPWRGVGGLRRTAGGGRRGGGGASRWPRVARVPAVDGSAIDERCRRLSAAGGGGWGGGNDPIRRRWTWRAAGIGAVAGSSYAPGGPGAPRR